MRSPSVSATESPTTSTRGASEAVSGGGAIIVRATGSILGGGARSEPTTSAPAATANAAGTTSAGRPNGNPRRRIGSSRWRYERNAAIVVSASRTRVSFAPTSPKRPGASATKVIAAVKAAGGTNVQTTQISLEPQTNDAGKTTGYVAENDVSADVGVAKAGALVDAAAGAGATTISGVSFSLSSSAKLYEQALGAALADAKAKAAALGQAGSFAVGAIQSVSEQSSAPQPVAFGASAGKTATPVEPGTQDVTADVQVTYAIS